MSSSGPNFVFGAEFRLRGRISSSGPNFVFGPLRSRITSYSGRPSWQGQEANFVFGPNFVFSGLRDRISSSPEFRLRGRILSSGPNFVFEFRLRAQFELRLLSSNFVFIVFGIRASGGVRNGDPVYRVNAQMDSPSCGRSFPGRA